MDFDDLDEMTGPSLEDKRNELLEKQVPTEMPGAAEHVGPNSRGFAARSALKLLYLHGPGSTDKMAKMQISNMFSKLPCVADMKLMSTEHLLGTIVQQIHEIHADPIVQEQFRPYGTEFCSYLDVMPYAGQLEAWGGIGAATDRVRKELKENGPFDGICGFDMGGNVAFNCARLAMEGDKDFQEKFHFLILFSTTAPKDNGYYTSMSGLCKEEGEFAMMPLRPKAPLQLPVFLSFAKLEDDARSYVNYEEMVAMIHPEYRTVYIHDQGHRPPNIQKGTEFAETIEKFITSMQAGIRFKLNELGNSLQYKDYWLPVNREPLPTVESDMPRRIFVVTDPLGAHGPLASTCFDTKDNPAQEIPVSRKIRFDLARQVRGLTFEEVESALKEAAGDMELEVIHVTSDKLKDMKWHPEKKDWYGRYITTDDVISLPWSDGRFAAEDLLEEMSVSPMDSVAVIGLGTGAYLAMHLTEAIMRVRFTTPSRLFLVTPPTVLPLDGFPGMGWLADVPVRHLTAFVEVAGPHWMAQVATLGHFSQSLFASKEELLKMLGTEATKMSDDADDFVTKPERLKEISDDFQKTLVEAYEEFKKANEKAGGAK